ncbi:hypothetical protein LPY66_07475 [Dehalobacter sp. DCM]|uniref:hypothetical protein n=1 Tax=Dehalobacter sp. DCM TaxID=2907827 RepID=UPI003081829A|nr:hypothetical protein LPY66_07475 [Dehalobacter sp. DCM]
MKGKIAIVALCLIAGCLLTSGGYGYWQKDLTIKGIITVTEPEKKVENDELLKSKAGNVPEGIGTGDPGAGDPGAGDPGTGDPGSGDPGAGGPGAGDPGAGDPGAGDPGAGDPGAGDPGAGDLLTGDLGSGALETK